MQLHLIAFGKLRTPGLRESADYYLRNIQPWVRAGETELKALHVPDKSAAARQQIQLKESALLTDTLKSRLSPRGKLYLLDERGMPEATQSWAQRVRDWEGQDVPEVALCIGSSLGFSEELRRKADGLLSLGPQTLSHELARVVLLEQLYRAWSLVRGHPYHNEG